MVTGDRSRIAAAVKALTYSALRERGEPGAVVVECSQLERRQDGPGDQVPGSPAWAVIAIGDETAVSALVRMEPGTTPSFDEWRGGLGLALPVARRVIEAHGGALWSGDAGHSRAASALRLPLRT
jgi:signal transduction histidine kinase